MKEFTIKADVPDGWEAVEYRHISVDYRDTPHYLERGKVRKRKVGELPAGPVLILRKAHKVHKEPELVYCLQVNGCDWKKYTNWDDVLVVKKISTDYNMDGMFDLILIRDIEDGTEMVALGHWNDGPLSAEENDDA